MRASAEALLVWYARAFPIGRGKLRVIDSLWRMAAGDGDTQRVARLKHGGLRMPCDISEMLQRQFYFFGTYLMEAQLLELWTAESKGAKTVFDVGANAGIFSLVALSAQPLATVHAFEPTPEIALRLRETAALNALERLHVHEVAISSDRGHAALVRFRGETGTNEGMNFIRSESGDSPDREMVETISLDSFCLDNRIDRIDLLKLDIQGQEHLALTGARNLLRDGRIGTVFLELNWASADRQLCPATESIGILASAGYEFARPGRNLVWREQGRWLSELSDVVARPADSRIRS